MQQEGQVQQANSVQNPPNEHQSGQSTNTTKNSAENKLFSLGIIFLVISIVITLLYFFSASTIVEETSSYFQL